ncbi:MULTISPECIES: aliphatic sulfonate ABC transporter substrate-binding protein [Paraburkholderia]|uniref:aliphatic sulfonate ABC transporter substrate-binding protein n=1 Tax=Paraburkholderia TaxID=1822464 RepID=UPI00224E9289|nr:MULTISPECIES: aliphatic sulfonate ABC transporter substrate-binding protein [Paraburkholderia]MCX4161603.1 aliphatic sulfonate ABC transporter substrate-binding protein [Paraburkholderia megapolitana]MDN7157099.1 aliphatic sulfonate ABC transporter substrate-binding protein [Paraburkholderia sp. CHISQ3]MDQ6494144.1 aliphatic sulfonate ABC transporter substrate-binding protein [Paraburkholderia megapolitana]
MLTATVTLLVTGVLASALCLPSAASARETVSISYQRSSTLFILLKRTGELEKKLGALGYDVSWHEFSTGLLQSLNAGSVDLHADVADAFALFTQAANAPLTYYAEETSAPSAQAIIVPPDSAIRTVSDLKGKRVAVSKGSGCNFLLLAALAKAGLTINDIQVRYLEAPDALAAFRGGNVDAWVIWDPFLAAQQREAHVRVVADGSDGLAQYNRFYTATTSFAERHPDVLRAVFDELKEKGQWVKAHPQEAAQILAPLWGNLPAPTVELANSRRSYAIVPVQRDQLGEQQRIADTYRAAGLIPATLKATDIRIWTPPGR